METQLIYEIIGYLASVLIAVSLMMRSLIKLRIINLLGAVFFTVYGLLIRSYPVAAVNFFIVLVNLYYLAQIYGTREYFRLLEVEQNSEYLKSFLEFYRDEIRRFMPSFQYHPGEHDLAFFVLRDMVPAGLFLAHRKEPQTIFVQLDFVIPGYRDFKTGNFVFSKNSRFFLERNIHKICSVSGSEAHTKYLRRMGFRQEEMMQAEQIYCLNIKR
jgi:hypothetical protein